MSQKIKPIFFFIINPTSIKLFGYSNMPQNCFTQMPISMYSFHFVLKAERETYFRKNVGGSVLVKALQLSKRQFNFKPTALSILPQTRNDIFLCWQITQKSNNIDIFLKNYYIIKTHATLLQRDFYHVIYKTCCWHNNL